MVYAQAGVPIWTNRYSPPIASDEEAAKSVTVDTTGHIYVAGNTYVAGQQVMQTIKYASSGMPLWTNRYGAIATGNWDIALGSGGQGACVLGISSPFPSQFHYSLIAYSATGVSLWTNQYSIPSDGLLIRPAGIASDFSSGNVYLAGVTAASFVHDFCTIAYSPTGTALWTNFFGSDPQMFTADTSGAIGVGSNGNIYVGGTSTGNWVTVVYTPTGQPLWTNWFGGAMSGYDWMSDLAVGRNGDVVLTGTADNDEQIATIRYSSAGVPLWTNFFAMENGVETPPRVVMADNGGVHVTWALDDDYATIAYASNGVPIWTNYYGGPDSANDETGSLAIDTDGNVYVTGSSEDDWATIAYSATGVPLWTNRFNGTSDLNDYPNRIAISGDGNVYVVGESRATNGREWVTIKYAGINPAPIQLQILQLGNKAIMSWTDSRFTLQAAPTLTGTFTNILGATSPHTNSISSAQEFFRLRAN